MKREKFLNLIRSNDSLENLVIEDLDLSEETFLRDEGESTITLRNVVFKSVNFRTLCFINFEFIDCIFQNSLLNNVSTSNSTFMGCDFIDVEFKWTRLSTTEFKDCMFFKCRFTGFSKFIECKFIDSDISNVDLSYSSFFSPVFEKINFNGVDFFKAYFQSPIFQNVEVSNSVRFLHQQCPEEGSFIGYVPIPSEETIVKILITEDSKRSSGTSYLCRCSKAKVIGILDNKGLPIDEEVVVYTNEGVDYQMRVGEIVETKEFEDNRWERGKYSEIEFYLNLKNAIKHKVYSEDEDRGV